MGQLGSAFTGQCRCHNEPALLHSGEDVATLRALLCDSLGESIVASGRRCALTDIAAVVGTPHPLHLLLVGQRTARIAGEFQGEPSTRWQLARPVDQRMIHCDGCTRWPSRLEDKGFWANPRAVVVRLRSERLDPVNDGLEVSHL